MTTCPKSKDADIVTIFEAWNKHSTMPHSVLARKLQGAIYNALKDYDMEMIVMAIEKYGTVIRDPKKYWWTLDSFTLAGFLTAKDGDVLTRFIDCPLVKFQRGDTKEQKQLDNLFPSL